MSPRNHLSKCRLCLRDQELREGHVFPKFIFDWMKSDAGPYFRTPLEPNRRLQDGLKAYLLCTGCEQRFSKAEGLFARGIFKPFFEKRQVSFDYGEWLHYFLVSVLWRCLTTFLEEHERDVLGFADKLRAAREEWRSYLLGQLEPKRFDQIHLLLVDVSVTCKQPVVNLNRYLLSAVDGGVARSESDCGVYAKFPGFVCFGWITPINESEWINTRVYRKEGVLLQPQKIRKGQVGKFILDRARAVYEHLDRQLSGRQREKIAASALEYIERILSGNLGRALEADFGGFVDPLLGREEKIGRNAPCPCGSGRKYKNCHGGFR